MNAPIEMMIKYGYEKITTFQSAEVSLSTTMRINTQLWKSLMDQAKQFLPSAIHPYLQLDRKFANEQTTPPEYLSECEAFRIVCDGIIPIKVDFLNEENRILFSVFQDERMKEVQYRTYDLDVALAYAHRLAADQAFRLAADQAFRLAADQAFRSISHKIV